MAVLATLEQAQVLPPEGTKEADRVIKSVIQFQSAFGKSADPSIQTFLLQAVQRKHGIDAPALVEQFRSMGWTSQVIEALADAELQSSREELRTLTTGLGHFNLSVEDFIRFMQLVRNGQTALASRGQNFPETYASHRQAMPGHQIEKQ